MPKVMTEDEARVRLGDLPGWTLDHGAIVKEFSFDGFPSAVAFVARLVAPSEAADHHPDLEIHYRRVTVTFTTHSAGGLTEKDFVGARMAEDASRCV